MPAVPQHHTPTIGTPFDSGEARRRLRSGEAPAYYARAFAWRAPGTAGDAAAHWSFIHHDVGDDGTIGPANVRACLSGIGVLNGGRIGVDGVRRAAWARDRRGIWRHLATHLEDAGMTAPPLADIGEHTDDLIIAEGGAGPWVISDEGEFVALFSSFGIVSDSGYVTTPTTFEDGAEVIVGAWGHNRNALPSGRGTVRVREDGAYLEGRFFLSTAAGRDTYETVKQLGPLQQWSYLARVVEAQPVELDGVRAIELTRVRLISVDPVDVGANPRTGTIAIQGLGATIRGCADDAEEILAAVRRRAEVRMRAGRPIGADAANDLRRYASSLRSIAAELDGVVGAQDRGHERDPRAAAAIAAAVLARAKAATTGGSHVHRATGRAG